MKWQGELVAGCVALDDEDGIRHFPQDVQDSAGMVGLGGSENVAIVGMLVKAVDEIARHHQNTIPKTYLSQNPRSRIRSRNLQGAGYRYIRRRGQQSVRIGLCQQHVKGEMSRRG